MSGEGNYYARAITRMPVRDCTSGFRCYSYQALQHLPVDELSSHGYAFQIETLYWLWRAGCPIVEVPTVYRDRLVGESKLTARILLEALIVPWRLRFNRRRRAAALSRSAVRP